jgi:hypothetical protein
MKSIVKCAYFGILLLSVSVWLTGCGGGGTNGCEDGAALLVSTNPSPAVAYSNNSDTIGITVTGQDEDCKKLPQGTTVELRITDQSVDNVGVFASNDSTTLNVVIGAFGASAEVKSTMPGTAKIVAFCAEYNLSATPVNITFEVEPIKGQCAVELSVDPSVIEPDGISTSTITATLTNDTGGTMPDGTEVKFTTTLGKFVESNNTEHTTTSSGSVATATLQSADLTEDADVTVTATFLCDDGNNTANSEQVRFGQLNNPIVNLRASANSVFADNVSTIDLVAEVYLPGGTKAGEGVEVDFLTDLGRFQESGEMTYIAHTDANGEAMATFIGGMAQGTAIISAGVYIDQKNAYDEVSINIRALGAVAFISATPSKLGVKGSGRDESSTLIFALLDTEDAPFPAGALVTFTHSPAPGVTLDPVSARTDANGLASTTLNAGRQATTVTVTATAQVGSVTLDANSPAIAIVGAKPNDRYMTFACEQFNIGKFSGIVFEEIECTVALADRYTNKIGFATNVIFKVEAGAITAEAITEEEGDDMGLAVTSTRTQDPDPADVTPLPGEPFSGSHNPRDGLVTVIAATTGEEEFTDVNGNGTYDDGEPFVDIGEPFVDENDNLFREPTEQFIDANSNDAYDGPNGEWDSDTLIWDQTWIVWSGNPVIPADQNAECAKAPGNRFSVLCPASFVIANFAQLDFIWEVKDLNLNPINSTLRVGVSVDGEGDEGPSNPELTYNAADTLGGGMDGSGGSYWTNGGGFSGVITVLGDDGGRPAAAGSVTLELDWTESTSDGAALSAGITSSGVFE